MTFKCKQCNKEFETKKRPERVIQYCSRGCYNLTKFGRPTWSKGKTFSEEHRKNLSLAHLGNTPWNAGKIGVQEGRKGALCKFWKGGVTKTNYPERVAVMNSVEYRLWRESVFKRDDYTCQMCGERGGKLNADHIKSFRDYPRLRLDLDNGRTLCKPCHKETPTYGGRARRMSPIT